MKTIAVITPNQRDFNVYKLSEERTGNNQNFIHISNLNCVYGQEFNDYISLTNSVKMPNLANIIKEVILRIK